jgi:predicted PurR-regulated permease PerM
MTPRNDCSHAGTLFKSVVAAAGALLAAYLIWKLRSLIVPVAVSSLMAYICRPLVLRLERHRMPRGLGIWLLLVVFVLAALFIANLVRSIMPTEIGALELKVRAVYKLNEGYKNLMGLDQSRTRGNWIYGLSQGELDPKVYQINRLLALTQEEHTQFLASRPRGPEASRQHSPKPGRLEQLLRLLPRRRCRRCLSQRWATSFPLGS